MVKQRRSASTSSTSSTSNQAQQGSAGPQPTHGNAAACELLPEGGGGDQLPYLTEMEEAFGTTFGDVSVWMGAEEELEPLDASAATDGQRVVFAESSPDRSTVAHELAHVVQGRNGAAGGSGLSDPGDASEKEAVAVGERVAKGEAAGEVVEDLGGAAVHRESPAGGLMGLVQDALGVRDDEAFLDALEELASAARDGQRAARTARKDMEKEGGFHSQKSDFVQLLQAVESGLAALGALGPEDVDLPDTSAVPALVEPFEEAVDAFEGRSMEDAPEWATHHLHQDVVPGLDLVFAGLGLASPLGASHVAELQAMQRALVLPKEAEWSGGAGLDDVRAFCDDLSEGVGDASDNLEGTKEALSFVRPDLMAAGDKSKLEVFDGVVDALDKTVSGVGKVTYGLSLVDHALKIHDLFAAIDAVAEADMEDPAEAAAAFDKLALAAGTVGEAFLPGHLAAYATLLKEAGKADFFASMSSKIDPGQRWKEEFEAIRRASR